MKHSLADIVETVKNAQANERGVTLLLGAGCSVEAGIPLANGFVKLIEQNYPRAFQHSPEKTYPHCMASLSPGERQDLVGHYIDEAKINWAHIGIAQLIKHGYVDRVLTTNFDPLVVRASAMVGEFPAVYDLAASDVFRPSVIPDKAVLYLHGQRSGFKILNTPEECQSLGRRLEPVFSEMGRGRTWIVVGYSGENDPVFDQLATIEQFDHRLYWIGYQDSEPSKHVREKLLGDSRFAFYVNGFDADDFFVALAQQLNCFPPDFISTPFSHLQGMMRMVLPYSPPGQDTLLNDQALNLITRAVEEYEADHESDELDAQALLIGGKYEEVTKLIQDKGEEPDDKLRETGSWAYLLSGNRLLEQARTKSGDEADALFAQVYEKYSAALEIKPDMHAALYNWGTALDDQARTKSDDEADALFAQAYQKFADALEVKPDKHEALFNWGNALSTQANTKSGDEADALFAQAYEKYSAALESKPDLHGALYNWGSTLDDQARTKSGDEADALFAQAYEKYAAALEIKPDKHAAFYNWGNALDNQARTKSGDEADALFAQAYEKYAAALEIKADEYDALINWAISLIHQSIKKSGNEKQELLENARGKMLELEEIAPGEVPYGFACFHALMGDKDKALDYLEMAQEAGKLPSQAHIEEDTDLDSLRDLDRFKLIIKRAFG